MLNRIIVTILLVVIIQPTSWAEEKPKESPKQNETKEKNVFPPIPNDTFVPSETVSEDYPVPFPTDI